MAIMYLSNKNFNCPIHCSIQLFHTFLCNSHNYHPRGAVDDPMHCCPRPKAKGNSASGHPQHRGGDSFDCCTERFEIVVLLPNSELTKGNNKRDADVRTVRHGAGERLFKPPITSLFVVRNIKCGYSFS